MTIWLTFGLLAGLLIYDLVLVSRKPTPSMREAILQSVGWVLVSCVFGAVFTALNGGEVGTQWFTAYFIEKTLSIDNLFVFLAIFQYFHIQHNFQQKVLYFSIIAAMVLRAVCIVFGVTLLENFQAVVYVFGVLLVYTAVRLCRDDAETEKFDQTPWARFLIKHFRFDLAERQMGAGKFFCHAIQDDGLRSKVVTYGTRLLFVLLVVAATDLLFATDSIPAALACSSDPYVVYSSNLFAVLGLRSLFFALSGLMSKFGYLKYGIAAVLALVGIKMLLTNIVTLPMVTWLFVVVGIIAISIAASLTFPKKGEHEERTV